MPGYLVADMVARPDLAPNFTTVHSIKCAGERISVRHRELLGLFCRKLVIWYGSTEVAGVAAFSRFEIKLVDGGGNVIHQGQTGELCVRSVHRFVEYRCMPEKFSQAVDPANWCHTGDMCHMNADGNFIMEGRKSDVMSIGTVKVFPYEIEKVFLACTGAAEVAVVPVPDIRLYECACACVIPKQGTNMTVNDVFEFCDGAWKPDAIMKPRHVILFNQFPNNDSGKTDRKLLAQEARKQLGLE
ncbi:ACSF2-like protein [Mya arenaria]|uniref:ACSF2-like protein n=1 Tax=Mya arenaria TaxID=6604 RepID=A0ABY7DVP8_MYAAR|nr:ACSF2-like protein [Mya arenaria]